MSDTSLASELSRWQRGWPVLWSCRAKLLKQLLQVMVLSFGICLLIWLSRKNVSVMSQVAYSLPMGLVSWLVIDGGRFFIDQDSPHQFPRGWKALVLVITGIGLGFIAGTNAGDAYSGWNTWELIRQAPSTFAYILLFSISVGTGITWYFYQRGQEEYLRAELEVRERQATQAQLKLLQSQLDPHMLFNTLANLRALIPAEPARAVQMLDQLNDFLRSTLAASRTEMHPLQAEFDRLRDYLSLMQVRMGQRLAFSLDLPAGLAALKVPTLILQTLVENAIVHGLEPKVEGGSVVVKAQREGSELVLTVQDDGLGIDASSMTEGFGLAQVRERGQQLYGEAFTIKIIANYVINTAANGSFSSLDASKAASGCTVSMRIPLQAL